MENKEENVDLMEKQSGVTAQTESVPAVGAGVEETKDRVATEVDRVTTALQILYLLDGEGDVYH